MRKLFMSLLLVVNVSAHAGDEEKPLPLVKSPKTWDLSEYVEPVAKETVKVIKKLAPLAPVLAGMIMLEQLPVADGGFLTIVGAGKAVCLPVCKVLNDVGCVAAGSVIGAGNPISVALAASICSQMTSIGSVPSCVAVCMTIL